MSNENGKSNGKKQTRPHSDRNQGRKPLPDGQQKLVGALRLTQSQWDKYKRLGGVGWLRDKIDRAKEPA